MSYIQLWAIGCSKAEVKVAEHLILHQDRIMGRAVVKDESKKRVWDFLHEVFSVIEELA